MPELHLDPNAALEEVHLGTWVFRLIKHRWLGLPPVKHEGFLQNLVEARPRQLRKIPWRLEDRLDFVLYRQVAVEDLVGEAVAEGLEADPAGHGVKPPSIGLLCNA